MWRWLADRVVPRRAVAWSTPQHIVTGHYHHFSVTDHGPRVWVQCPANDGGSRWWQDATGAVSRAGMLTFVSTPDGPNEFRIL